MAEKRMELPSKAFSPPHSHDNLISSPDLDSDGEELPPAYREEFEFRDEVSIFRDQAYLDEKEYLELCDTKEREQYAAEVSAPPAGADSDGPSASDDEMLNEALKFARRQPTIRRSSNGLLPKLQKPVVVPQIRNGVGVPFARAFSEALKAYDVTEEEWLAFIDNLNVVATANPPLQVLDLAGNIVGFLPHEWAMATSFAISAVAQIGTYIISKARTEAYMARANKQFFAPRQLKATLCTTEALYKVLGLLPQEEPDSSKELLNIPFLSRKSSSSINLAPLDSSAKPMTIQERRLKTIESYIAPLDFDVPQPEPQTTVLRKLCAWQVKRDAKMAEKRLLKARARKQERLGNWQGSETSSSSVGIDYGGPSSLDNSIHSPSAHTETETEPAASKTSNTSSKAAAIGITALSMVVPLPRSVTSKGLFGPKSSRYEERADRAKKRYERDLSRGRGDSSRADSRYNREMEKLEQQKSKELRKVERGDKEERAHRKILWVLIEDLEVEHVIAELP